MKYAITEKLSLEISAHGLMQHLMRIIFWKFTIMRMC